MTPKVGTIHRHAIDKFANEETRVVQTKYRYYEGPQRAVCQAELVTRKKPYIKVLESFEVNFEEVDGQLVVKENN